MKFELEILCCPKCKSELKMDDDSVLCSNLKCEYSSKEFSKVNGKLVLVDFDNSIIQHNALIRSNASSTVKRTYSNSVLTIFAKKVLNGSGCVSRKNFDTCAQLLKKIQKPKILLVGGGTIGTGCDVLVKNFQEAIISFDVYNSENIDFIADAHSIPLINGSVDLVIIQAVLEHVLDPVKVVNECFRVLKGKGYIYSETPFLQHVHEGTFDFTRYTLLGHRLLFKQFEELGTGFIGGLGQSLLWSIEYFVSGVFRNRIAGKIAKGCLFWLRWIEKIIPDTWNNDGACGCYFLGEKSETVFRKQNYSYLDEYKGAQQ
jgi:SAM-dependent methyltransferase/uncharacterized protein YbaR (Trm112 family)